MTGKILNYSIRILVIVIGLALLSGIIKPESMMVEDYVFRVMGIVIVLFGIYRLISYRNALKRYNFSNKSDEE